MEHVLSVIVAAATLSASPVGMTNSAPVAVSSCSVTEIFDPASIAETVAPVPLRTLQLTFTNGQDAVATKVVFDVFHDGTRSTVTEQGRFSKGVPIERLYEQIDDAVRLGPAVCAVASVAFADGTTWAPSHDGAATGTTLR